VPGTTFISTSTVYSIILSTLTNYISVTQTQQIPGPTVSITGPERTVERTTTVSGPERTLDKTIELTRTTAVTETRTFNQTITQVSISISTQYSTITLPVSKSRPRGKTDHRAARKSFEYGLYSKLLAVHSHKISAN
jgi:hypothetical protein